jgi:hypothetical protein
MKSTFYRVRATHYTSGRQMAEPTAWRVLCSSHAHRGTCATVESEKLDGDWVCTECARFTRAEEQKLREALRDPKFSHTRVRGYYQTEGLIYHRDPESPTGVFAARTGFDPQCGKAMAIVRELTGTPNAPHPGDIR